MKKIMPIVLLCHLIIKGSFAQDTSAYQLQRQRVNQLLAQRSAKFGQYDESLTQRTGIFGFQTKRDIKNSNEILREIAITDNHIFQELKVLMDYKDLEVEKATTSVSSNAESISNYRRTIKNLQDQNEELNKNLSREQHSGKIAYLLAVLFFAGCGVLGYIAGAERLRKKG